MATRKSEDNERLIDRDLTALAREGKLSAAHGVDGAVMEVLGLLSRGGKHPLLSGDPGVLGRGGRLGLADLGDCRLRRVEPEVDLVELADGPVGPSPARAGFVVDTYADIIHLCPCTPAMAGVQSSCWVPACAGMLMP